MEARQSPVLPFSPPKSSAGYLDLHCHLLPGVDDGCESIEESLECIAMLSKAGFRGAVCTPHACVSAFPDNVPRNIAKWVDALRKEVRREGLAYELWAGAELRLAENNIPWLEKHGVPTLGESKVVLTDWWGTDWPEFCDGTLDYLLAQGYQPILAHPERMGLADELLLSVIDSVAQRGVWLQGNLNSLGGGEGRRAKELAWGWLDSRRYHLLASDTHGPDSVPPRVRGLQATQKDAAPGAAEEFLTRRTHAAIGVLEPAR